ncbi:hypothetical protein DJ71_27295 [Halorubrum sp. E3]|uniref:Uncharacterized protein n=1 Tax=Halorubrum persicum TaxID=1383844 RepID=A0A2G1WIQ5_9EURY|nr:hypothetical protein [Halorubrum persicum]OYR54550.1 hypothetical protein DJ71_27295 [Halorubrum sp. E3]PHQ38870.1 hypothetical protein DJ69_09310 [Halorubrum persicum]
MRSFSSPETHFAIVPSGSPPSVDGLAITEPKFLRCDECGAQVRIDGPDETKTTIDNLPHDRGCSQRAVASRYYEEQYVR